MALDVLDEVSSAHAIGRSTDHILASRLDSVGEAVALQIADRARQLRAEGRSIVSLSTGEPDFPTPKNIKDAAIRAINDNFTKYTAAEGIMELRSALAEKFARDNGIVTTAERVIISSGGKHALSNALLALVDPGDEVIIPSPCWLSYPAMVAISEGRVRFVDTHPESDWLMSPAALREAITPRTKVLMLNTPVNPTSGLYTEADLMALAEVIEESGIYVIVDELYEKLVFDGRVHFSLGSVREIADRVITVNGFSKAYAMTGWRLGYSTGPKEVMEAVGRLQSQMVSHPSSISQKAGLEAITGPQESIEEMRLAFERRRNLVVSLLADVPDISFMIPKAAFYVFFDVSKYLGRFTPGEDLIVTSTELCKYLLDTFGLALVPGDAFNRADAMRLSFAASDADIVEGVRRLKLGLASLR